MKARAHATEALLLWFGLTCVYLALASGHLYGVDIGESYYVAESLVQGRLSVPEHHLFLFTGTDGKLHSARPLGQSLLFAPAAFLGRVACPASSAACHENLGKTLAAFEMAPMAAGSCCAAFLALLILGYRRKTAWACALILAFATPMLHLSRTPWDITSAGFFFTLGFAVLAASGTDGALAWIAGSLFAATHLIRYDAIIAIIPLCAAWVIQEDGLQARFGAAAKKAFRLLAPIAAVSCFHLTLNFVKTGSPWTFSPPGISYSNFSASASSLVAGLLGMLLSPGKGIFWYAPPLLVACAGMLRWPRERRLVLFSVLAGLAAWLLFQAGLVQQGGIRWGAGGAWGPKYLYLLLPVLMIFAAPIVEAGLAGDRKARWAIGAAAFLGLFVSSLTIPVNYSFTVVQTYFEPGIVPEKAAWQLDRSLIVRQAMADWRFLSTGDAAGDESGPAKTIVTLSKRTQYRTTCDIWPFYVKRIGSAKVFALCLLLAATLLASGVYALTFGSLLDEE